MDSIECERTQLVNFKFYVVKQQLVIESLVRTYVEATYESTSSGDVSRLTCLLLASLSDLNMSETSVPTPAIEAPKKPVLSTWAIVQKAARRAGEGGIAGAAAMGIKVGSLMWMRTTSN